MCLCDSWFLILVTPDLFDFQNLFGLSLFILVAFISYFWVIVWVDFKRYTHENYKVLMTEIKERNKNLRHIVFVDWKTLNKDDRSPKLLYVGLIQFLLKF